MIWLVLLFIPLMTSALFAGALLVIWRQRPEARHAASWATAFAMIAGGWLAMGGRDVALASPGLFGTTASLCWLAAALALVHGLRQRAGRRDRSGVLAAIWIAIALATSLMQDLTPVMAGVVQPTMALMSASGLMLAAVAVGPRCAGQWRRPDWAVVALLVGLAIAHLLLAWFLLAAIVRPAALMVIVTVLASIAYVAFGLGTVLLLNRDLSVALERLARTDPLTGVWNRRGFDEAAPHLLARMRAAGSTRAAVAIADIDSFKAINDRFGHTTGDRVLSNFAALLVHAVRPGDLLARLGGEEFALLAIGVDGSELFQRVEEVRRLVSVPQEALSGLPVITSSFGVAGLDPQALSLRDALERADHALYQAKREGRNRTVLDEASVAPPAD